MAKVSDITTTPLSGLNHIDALLETGPDWNYLTAPANANTIYYTFSVASGNEEGRTGQQAFSLSQQVATRTAFSYLQEITGIQFVETSVGTAAQIHLANLDIANRFTTGLCSWTSPYSYRSDNTLTSYDADAYVYLDNAEFAFQNRDLSPGGYGYETLLHELGHALGLKHPFEGDIQLPSSKDNTSYTLMSYDGAGGPHQVFSPYDVAALNWLYGGDGLRGSLGINSTTGARYLTGSESTDILTGTAFNDTLRGNAGNDVLDGGAGTDTAVYMGARSAYTIALQGGDGALSVSSNAEGTDTLRGVEFIRFADMTVASANVAADTAAPAAPAFAVAKNQNNYAFGNTPLISGSAEANATVRVYVNDQEIGSAKADANGVWQLKPANPIADGLNYRAHTTATDAAGNTSAPSPFVFFNVDSVAPLIPTGSVSLAAGGNQPVFSGNAEAGTTIQLFRAGDFVEIGRAVAGQDGRWVLESNPLPNGNYEVAVVSLDLAGNATSAQARVQMGIQNAANQTGSIGKDLFTMGAGSSAVDGREGIDVAVYKGARADFNVQQAVWGHTVTDRVGNGGTDTLINVERVQFTDGWKALDIDGVAGQAYRLYQAAFDRPAEAAGLGYWIWRMDGGSALLQIAQEFTKQPEFDAKYGVNPSDSDFIKMLYRNVLDREAEGAGYEYWMERIEGSSRAQILTEFSESLENKGNVIDVIAKGMDYVPWA